MSAHEDVRSRVLRVLPEAASGAVQVLVEMTTAPGDFPQHVELELRARPLALGARLPEAGVRRPPAIASARRRVTLTEETSRVAMTIQVPGHRRWSPDEPWRYLLGVRVHDSERAEVADDERSFGFRDIRFDADGLHIDDERMHIKGVLYQPHYISLGGLAPPAEELEAEVQSMLDTGFNLVRAHVRPAPPAFLDAADRLGLMVLEEPAIGWVNDSDKLEGWLKEEIAWMVRRDHHHPSIVMWCVLNELSGDAYLYGESLVKFLAQRDPTRPILEDSGGFFRSHYQPVGAEPMQPMLDEHAYPPCPIPWGERERLRTMGHETGPALVSEFGYGMLMDTEEYVAEFARRGVLGSERDIFVAMRERTMSALATGETWSEDAWLNESAAIHADMTADMVELLRANADLDGLVYTQWQAVHSEASAGLLEPWGQSRDTHEAMTHALRPLQVTVLPSKASVRQGELQRVDVAVVNDTGAPVYGEVVVEADTAVRAADGTRGRGFGYQEFPPGVTQLSEEGFQMEQAGEVVFRGYLAGEAGELLESSRPVRQTVVPAAPASWQVPLKGGQTIAVELVVPDADPGILAFAERENFGVRALRSNQESIPVALMAVDGSDSLGTGLTSSERVRLWRQVYEGGSLIVLLNDLPQDHIGRIAGSPRGLRTYPQLPVRVGVGLSTGNFIGRCDAGLVADGGFRPGDVPGFVFEAEGSTVEERVPDDGTPRLFLSHEASFSPVAMLMGRLPARSRSAAITLNHYRQRVGSTIASVPFGKGQVVFVGLPLLEPIAGGPDPLRDRLLAQLVIRLATEARHRERPDPGRPLPLDERQLATYALGMERLARVSAMADRFSFILAGSTARSNVVVDALIRRDQGLAALFEGNEGAWEHLQASLEDVWAGDVPAFVEREEQVLAKLKAVIMKGSPEARELGSRAVVPWGHGVVAFIQGDPERAHELLDAADALLGPGISDP